MNGVFDAIIREVRAGSQLNIRQYGVLIVSVDGADQAGDRKPVGVREIANALKLPRSSVTRAVDMLAEVDMVKRRRVEGDRRLIDVVPTPKGRKRLAQLAGA